MCLISFHPSAILYTFVSKTRFLWCTWNVFPLRILHSFSFFLPSVSWFFHDFCLFWQVIVQCLVILGDPLIYLGQMSNWDQGFQCDCIETVTWECVQRWSCHLLCLWLFLPPQIFICEGCSPWVSPFSQGFAKSPVWEPFWVLCCPVASCLVVSFS